MIELQNGRIAELQKVFSILPFRDSAVLQFQ